MNMCISGVSSSIVQDSERITSDIQIPFNFDLDKKREASDNTTLDSRTEDFSIIRFLRTCKGMSQKDFAILCGISPIYCQGLENGKRNNPSDEVINRIAEVCGIKSSTIRFFLEKRSEEGEKCRSVLIHSLESLEQKLSNQS